MSRRRGGAPAARPVPVVVVTGASSGIGRATVRAFAARGSYVVLASRSAQALRSAEREAADAGAAGTLVVPTDVTDEQAVDALAERAVERFGRIDVWVNSAAVMAYGALLQVPSEVYRRVLETNVFGTVHVARSAVRRFREQGGGTLVVVGSLLSRATAPDMGSYVTSKWAVRGFSRVLQQELRGDPGVHVCVVDPAGVDTPIYLQAANYVGREGRPPPPVASPERVAEMIVGLVERPRRSRLVGAGSPVILLGFSAFPPLYDALVGPLMRVAGLSRSRIPPRAGTVFDPRPEGEATHGRWGRHRLRGAR